MSLNEEYIEFVTSDHYMIALSTINLAK